MNIPSPGLAVLRAQRWSTGIFITSTGLGYSGLESGLHTHMAPHCTHSGTAAEPEEKRAREAAYYLYFSNRTTLINQQGSASTVRHYADYDYGTGKEAGGKG